MNVELIRKLDKVGRQHEICFMTCRCVGNSFQLDKHLWRGFGA